MHNLVPEATFPGECTVPVAVTLAGLLRFGAIGFRVIVRNPTKERYKVNQAREDPRLSLKAKGRLPYLLTKPDLLHGTISVERIWTVVSGSGPVLGPPKTDAGTRRVAVPPNVAPVLEHHLSTHVGAKRDAWLFSGSDGMPAHPRTLDHAWTKARARKRDEKTSDSTISDTRA